ncbi:MAG TPA: hypothetical protein VGZ52_02900 [Acidimicrobiales bacterium]|nr:hypothetical protein [Acidimicrobiales bacterium]
MTLITVEEISGRVAFRRFVEFPYSQFRSELRWSPPLAAVEAARLDPQRNPFFDDGDGEYFLARRAGALAGRITAHVATRDTTDGWFGFFDSVDDPRVVAALVMRAAQWLGEHGCTTITGPASFTPDDGPGVLVDGFHVAGTTGRPWNPEWYGPHLEGVGLVASGELRTWRLAATGTTALQRTSDRPAVAGRFVDPRIVLPGVVAVPDLTLARGSAVTLARRSKRNDWDGCTIVALDGDPAVLVPELQGAAAMAGYSWVVSPWCSDADAVPETVHVRFTMKL